jgi:hypothetical protein
LRELSNETAFGATPLRLLILKFVRYAEVGQRIRHGLVFCRPRDAPPVPVRLLWWRDDPHPATSDVVGLLAELYRPPATSR